jgi:cytidine deaminase
MEYANESNFKELIKNRIYFYNDQINEDGMKCDFDGISDKCIICEEYFNKEVLAKKIDEDIEMKEENNENDDENITDNYQESQSYSQYSNSNFNFNSNSTATTKFNMITGANINIGIMKQTKCPSCKSLFHMTCLASSALLKMNKLALIPEDTQCLICLRTFIWSEWIKCI